MTSLFLYKILFMAELLVTEALFTLKIDKRKHFALRVLASIAVCASVAVFYPIFPDFSYSWWYTSIMFTVMFMVTFAAIFFVYDLSPTAAFFCAVTAYTIQHLVYELFSFVANFIVDGVQPDFYGSSLIDFSKFNFSTLMMCLVYLDIYVVVFGFAYNAIGKRFRRNQNIKPNAKAIIMFGGFVLLIDVVLNAVVTYINDRVPLEYNIVVVVYNVLSCLLVFYIQRSIFSEKDMKNKMDNMEEILRISQKQYSLQKEAMDIINVKCHDLRHQIRRFADKAMLDKSEIDEINNAISIYDASVKTGNEVVDVILGEKGLLCHEKRLDLTCMADCSALSFVQKGDLYALFGNILDNAIEAASKVEDDSKRCIGFNAYTVDSMISITVENYYDGNISFSSDGLPMTIKQNKNYHGYGMRSIRAIVEKYGGDLSIVVKEEIFRLNIFFPVPDEMT